MRKIDATKLIGQLSTKKIKDRLDEIHQEARALLVLLRAARAREDRKRPCGPVGEEAASAP